MKVPFLGTFSRHGKAQASLALLIWLNENVRLFATVCFLCWASALLAQHRRAPKHVVDSFAVYRKYMDSLAVCRQQVDSLSASAYRIEGGAYRLFVPLTFYHQPTRRSLGMRPQDQTTDDAEQVVNAALMHIYLNRPDLVSNDESRLRQRGTVRRDMEKTIKQEVVLTEKAAPFADELLPVETEVLIKKPNFWTFSGDQSLQFLQNYISDNWYKGGESNYSMVGSVTLNANYNNKQKLRIDNKLELKLGFQNSRGDTLHRFKANNDLIRYTGKIGVQAAHNWYYSLQLLAYTQFTQGLKSNDKNVYSDFMSPFTANLGLGMDYSVNTKNKRLTGNVNISLLSFNFRYVDRANLAARNGIAGGRHHTLEEFGSQLTSNLVWKISNQISWKTRLYAYTTYKKTLVEWENTITLAVSKFISANIFLYPRFDDSTKRDDKLDYLQFNEYSSLGFSYSF